MAASQKNHQAIYTQGNILKHMITAASASSIGMLAIFVVDLADLYFISLLGIPQLAAAVGFSGILLFISSSVGMALSVAAGSLVSQALGRNNQREASQFFLDVGVFAVVLGISIASAQHFLAPTLLEMLGARGEVLNLAVTYFRIVNASLPLLLIAMTCGAGLRAAGSPGLSMQSTVLGGLTNAILDPLFIFGLWIIPGMGLEGAAIATVISRFVVLSVALYGSVGRLGLLKGASLLNFSHSLRPVLAIAMPSLITSLSTPIASAYVTNRLSVYGDEVIAGVSVFGRILPIAFVGLFTLTMALAPVVGQNYGAGHYDRVRTGLKDAALFSFGYAIPVACLLAILAPWLASFFNLSGEGAEVLIFYCRVLAFTYGFFGLHLASSQVFTNTGHPTWSTYANLGRDFLLVLPLVFLLGGSFEGVLVGQYAATVISGSLAFGVAWWHTSRLDRSMRKTEDVQTHKFHRPVTAHSPVRGH